MKRIALFMIMLMIAILSYGAAVDGKWEGTVNGPEGKPSPIMYMFESKGTTLNGTVIGGGKVLPIRDGKINGQNISFIVDVTIDGNKMVFNYQGQVSPTKINLNASINGQAMAIVVTKVK